MPSLSTLSPEALSELRSSLRGEYEALKAQGLKLDMTRGKPASDQLDLAAEMLALPGNRTPPPRTAPTRAITATSRACPRPARCSRRCSARRRSRS
ncbi:hypothetical protein DHODJN_21745 [Methylorubrum extorquens]